MKPDKPTSKERLEYMVQAVDKIQAFCQRHTLESFLKDDLTISACLYQYAIIAEAMINVDNTILAKYPYPWYKVKAFRNFILHDYPAIEVFVIWDTTTEILPELNPTCLLMRFPF